MSKNLLIVESPAKANTLKKYLGEDFTVLASYGHIRDLIPKSGAVEPENQFHMNYELIARNADHVEKIVQTAEKAQTIYLATDPDREGEAISWHLLTILQERAVLKDKVVHRVVFHEITEKAIKQAIANPRTLAQDLVDAQQARRALDYLVGFNLSPLLWRKVQPNLSAGRVQSPALRLIVERDRAIQAFQPKEYWSIHAEFKEFKAHLTHYQGEKLHQFSITNEQDAQKALQDLIKEGAVTVADVSAKERQRHPTAPFITSTLQQESARKLRFSAQRTMRIAQSLYEDGLITYMRTDSVHLAEEALDNIRDLIKKEYGSAYLPSEARVYKTKAKNAQEAHEAIRPTDCSLTANQLNRSADEQALYDLIWKRTLASQMTSAVLEQTTVELHTTSASQFRATGSVIQFDGFMRVYLEDNDNEEQEEDFLLPQLTVGERLVWEKIQPEQHFTQPPARFSEASLIKALEEFGIGRPSTYASIISTLLNREYVAQENRKFQATVIGKVVNDFLTHHFEQYVDYDFTAKLEDELDAVSRGEMQWKPLLKRFWDNLEARIEEKKDIPREEVMQARELGIDPKSGKPVSVRVGRFGPFVQIGSKDDEEKPRFASLMATMDMETLTLEQGLALFQLPRSLGETDDGEPLSTSNGRFGPYIQYGKKYVSLPKEEDPLTVTRERALALIAEKIEAERKKYIKEIPHGDAVLQVLTGRFGPYVTDGKTNASIPKAIQPDQLTLEEALTLIARSIERKNAKLSKKALPSDAEEKPKKTRKSAKTTESASEPADPPKRGRKKASETDKPKKNTKSASKKSTAKSEKGG